MPRLSKTDIKRLREIRQTLEMTQVEFADAVGIRGKMAYKQISEMECGRRPIPGNILRAAELLLDNMMMKTLLEGS